MRPMKIQFRLRRIFTGRICPKVRFLALRLNLNKDFFSGVGWLGCLNWSYICGISEIALSTFLNKE